METQEFLCIIEQDLESYPPTLTAKHIAEYLGISVSTAYKLMKSGSFTTATIPTSKLIVVPKTLFIAWYAKALERNKALDETRLQGI